MNHMGIVVLTWRLFDYVSENRRQKKDRPRLSLLQGIQQAIMNRSLNDIKYLFLEVYEIAA